jgi:hypothetical protein
VAVLCFCGPQGVDNSQLSTGHVLLGSGMSDCVLWLANGCRCDRVWSGVMSQANSLYTLTPIWACMLLLLAAVLCVAV